VNRIFSRNWLFQILKNSLREKVRLNCVLIAGGKLSTLNRGTEQIRAFIDKDSSGPIGRRVERDFYFDAALGTKDLHSLIGRQLFAASKD
jgi:hypothetical protein